MLQGTVPIKNAQCSITDLGCELALNNQAQSHNLRQSWGSSSGQLSTAVPRSIEQAARMQLLAENRQNSATLGQFGCTQSNHPIQK